MGQIYTGTEILQRSKRPIGLTHFNNGLHSTFAHVFHSSQTKANAAIGHRKSFLTFVDIRCQYRNAHTLTFCNIKCYTICRIHHAGQKCRHKFNRIMGFQISGLICHHCIGCTMALIEAVACKVLNQFKYFCGNGSIYVVLFCTV